LKRKSISRNTAILSFEILFK